VYRTGCSGVITHAERMPDGRSNIVLRGVERFRILDEDHSRSYRRAFIEPLLEPELAARDRDEIRNCRAKLESMLTPAIDRAGGNEVTRMPAAMADEDLVNALSQYLDLEPLEKQALLERPSLRARATSLVELLEMKMLATRTPAASHLSH
jgi:Lon protease-like protein